MSMFIVLVLSKTNCDKEPPENIRGEWKLMNQMEQWFLLRQRERQVGPLVCVCVRERDWKDIVRVSHLKGFKIVTTLINSFG